MDGASFHTAEGVRDIGGSGLGQGDGAITAGDGGGALNVATGDAAEAVADIERTLHVGNLHRAIVVIDGGIASGGTEFNAAKGVVEARRPGVPNDQGTVAIVELGAAADVRSVDVAETIFEENRGVGGDGDVVVDGIGGVFAAEPVADFLGIIGDHADSGGGLFDVDADFISEPLRLLVGISLNANGGGDF